MLVNCEGFQMCQSSWKFIEIPSSRTIIRWHETGVEIIGTAEITLKRTRPRPRNFLERGQRDKSLMNHHVYYTVCPHTNAIFHLRSVQNWTQRFIPFFCNMFDSMTHQLLAVLWLKLHQHLDRYNEVSCLFIFCLMVFNATFNTISVILWRSVLFVEETGIPGENHQPVASHWQTWSNALYTGSYLVLSRARLIVSIIFYKENMGDLVYKMMLSASLSLKFMGKSRSFHKSPKKKQTSKIQVFHTIFYCVKYTHIWYYI